MLFTRWESHARGGQAEDTASPRCSGIFDLRLCASGALPKVRSRPLRLHLCRLGSAASSTFATSGSIAPIDLINSLRSGQQSAKSVLILLCFNQDNTNISRDPLTGKPLFHVSEQSNEQSNELTHDLLLLILPGFERWGGQISRSLPQMRM